MHIPSVSVLEASPQVFEISAALFVSEFVINAVVDKDYVGCCADLVCMAALVSALFWDYLFRSCVGYYFLLGCVGLGAGVAV